MNAIVADLFRRREGEIDALNGLRAFAVLSILLLHLYVPAGPWLDVPFSWIDRMARNLTSGVDLFFVLSGFLLYSRAPLYRNDLLLYAQKRARRILPAYYFALAGAALYVIELADTVGQAGQLELATKLQTSLSYAWADLIFVSNYTPHRLLEPGWSLSVEVHFYLLLPLLVQAFAWLRKKGRSVVPLLGLLFVLPLVFRLMSYEDADGYFYTHTRLDGLVAGMLVVHLRAFDLSSGMKRLLLLVAVSLLLSAHLCTIEGFFYRTFRYTFFAAGFGLLLFLSLKSVLLARLLSCTALRFLARISYTMYLWHPILLTVGLHQIGLSTSSGMVDVLLGWTWALIVAVLGSTVLYVLLERPFLMQRQNRRPVKPA